MTYKYERKINWSNVYILAVTAIALVFIVAFEHENHCKNEEAKSYEREIQTLENTYQDLQKKYADKNNKLKIITDEYNELLEEKQWISLGEFKITHYGADCLGCSGITATGTVPQASRTIATDWNVIPVGSEVMINGVVYVVEDKGSAIQGNVIDVFVGSEAESIEKGTYYTEVYVKKNGG